MSELWLVACRDAGFAAGREAVLHQIVGEPPGGPQQSWAVWEPPATDFQPNSNYPLTRQELVALNARGRRDKHRVIAFTQAEPEVLLGYLRHELEHARQYQGNGPAHGYGQLLMFAIVHQLGNLDGAGSIYNLMPREVDANAAGAQLIRAHFGLQPSSRYRGLHAPLFRLSPSPGDVKTLFFRSFCFSFLFKEGIDAAFAQVGVRRSDYFRAQRLEFLDAWGALEADVKLGRLIERAYKAVPSRKAIRAAGSRPGDAWREAARRFNEANRQALAVCDWP